jgi:hypothetical protein
MYDCKVKIADLSLLLIHNTTDLLPLFKISFILQPTHTLKSLNPNQNLLSFAAQKIYAYTT